MAVSNSLSNIGDTIMKFGLLLKNVISTIETVISMILLGIFTLIMMGVNTMQRDYAQLENLSPSEDTTPNILVTKLSNR